MSVLEVLSSAHSIAGVIETTGFTYEWKFSNTNNILLKSPVFSFPRKHKDSIDVIVCQLLLTECRLARKDASFFYCSDDPVEESFTSMCKLKLTSCGGLESVTIIRYTLSYPGIQDETEEINCSSNIFVTTGKGIKITHRKWEEVTVKCNIEIVGVNPINTKPRAELNFDLGRDLTNALSRPQKFSDCTLCIDDQELQVHKFILAARSPVFEAMFCQDMKETKTGRVEIVDFEFDVIEEMINFIYTGTSPRNKTMADRLLQAADKYMIEGLVKLCGVTLTENLVVENAVSTLILADRYSAQDLKMSAVRFIVTNLSDVKKTKEWRPLREERKDLLTELFYRLDEVTVRPGVSA